MRPYYPIIYTLFIVSIFIFTACSNSEQSEVAEPTEEDVVDVIAASLSQEDGGLISDFNYLIQEGSDECGFMTSETFTDSEENELRSYVIDYDYKIEVLCDDSEHLIHIQYEYTAYREAELVRIDVSSLVESFWEFKKDDEYYTLNGSYTYSGEEEFKVRNSSTVSSDISYTSDYLKTDSAGNLLEGEMSFNYEAMISDNNWNYSGSTRVISTNTVQLDISAFEYIYTIDLIDGEVTKEER